MLAHANVFLDGSVGVVGPIGRAMVEHLFTEHVLLCARCPFVITTFLLLLILRALSPSFPNSMYLI
eukprot:m.38994 g.38994  ORF g.38994 m.38994 type:complete len:66 (-) comp10274_c0_seq2:918-1115(-)